MWYTLRAEHFCVHERIEFLNLSLSLYFDLKFISFEQMPQTEEHYSEQVFANLAKVLRNLVPLYIFLFLYIIKIIQILGRENFLSQKIIYVNLIYLQIYYA